MHLLYRLATFIFGNELLSTTVGIVSLVFPNLFTFVGEYFLIHFKKKLRKHCPMAYFRATIVTILLILTLLLLYYFYNSFYTFPSVVFLQLGTAEERIDDASDGKCQIELADDFEDNRNSYVFDAEPKSGSIIKKQKKIVLYCTFNKDKINDYVNGNATLDDMKKVALIGISAEYTGDGLYVGERIDKKKIKVTALYSNNTTKEIVSDQFKLNKTEIEKAGKNTFVITYENQTYNLVINALEPVLSGLEVSYNGLTPIAGEQLDPADFSVVAVFSSGLKSTVSEGDFSIEPMNVEEGDNNINITYRTKKKICKVNALGKNDTRPIEESEPNDSRSEANLVLAPCNISAKITGENDIDFYEVKIVESGALSILIDSQIEYTSLYLYGEDTSNCIWYSEGNLCNAAIGIWKDEFTLNLSKGTYYLQITGKQYEDSEGHSGNYSMTLTFASADCTESGGHTNWETAMKLSSSQLVHDQISITEKAKFYCIKVSESSRVTLSSESYMPDLEWRLYTSSSTTPFLTDRIDRNDSFGKGIGKSIIYLSRGTYYIEALCREDDNDPEYTGNYNFNLNIEVCKISSSSVLGSEKVYGVLTVDSERNIYDLKIPEERTLTILVKTEETVNLEIWEKDGTKRWSDNANADRTDFEVTLEKGNYTFTVLKDNDIGASYCINYK